MSLSLAFGANNSYNSLEYIETCSMGLEVSLISSFLFN